MSMTGALARLVSWAVIAGAAMAAVLAPASVAAQTAPATAALEDADKPLWSELNKPQQAALAPLAAEWDKMEEPRKLKWLEIANRFATMKPDEQQRLHKRMRDWLELTPEKRRVARENYALSKKLEKGQKSAQWEQYQALPEEEKRKLAAEAALKRRMNNLPQKNQPKPAVTNPPPGNPATPVPNAE